jgi:hypothetical protein
MTTVLVPGRIRPGSRFVHTGAKRAKSPAESNVGQWRSRCCFRLGAGSPAERCRGPEQALASVPAGSASRRAPARHSLLARKLPPSELIRGGAACRGCSVRGGHVLGPLPPGASGRASPGSPGPLWGPQHPAARSPAGQARRSSQPTPPSGGTVRRHQESTAAVAIGRCRLPEKSREPTGESDGLHSSRPGRPEQAAAHSRLSTRAQQMEASVETSATVADERGPVREAPWRRAAPSTDTAASRCRVLEDQSDREDGEWARETDRAARWWRPSQATGSGAHCARHAPRARPNGASQSA